MNDSTMKALTATGCDVRFDTLTRQLYATDASIYQLEPMGVAFPSSAGELSCVLAAAHEHGVPVTMRGAGTGLAGGAIGEGLIVEMFRHNFGIGEFDREKGSIRVDPGVVLDRLNDYLKGYGMCFGPDVATSSRATLGGMIANDSSGARAPVYGTTAQHVLSLDVVLADGSQHRVGPGHPGLEVYRRRVAEIVNAKETEIRRLLPDILVKRWHGYGIGRFLETPENLLYILSGSEGTLAAITSAELKVSPLPKEKAIGVIFFDSDTAAMAATVDLLPLKPAAIEHVDRVAFDQTKGQRAFKPARDLLELDDRPCASFLIVEFYDGVDDKLAALSDLGLGTRTLVCREPREMERVWGLRKAGLSLLTGRIGPAKPVAGLEDIAVPPDRLPDFVRDFKRLLQPLGLDASFYGHAASGLLHIRPLVDLHQAEDIARFRALSDGVSELTRKYCGTFAGEHGVGMARAEYLPDHLGQPLIDAMAEIKALFDPDHILNPGKVIPDGRYRIDTNLRQGAGHAIELPFTPALEFAFKDRSYVGNLEQCNGCGQCRKDANTMCPTFTATREEIMSTRGRANTIRAAIEGRLDPGDPLISEALDKALSNCLSCRACTGECPSNVNLSLLKADLLHARHEEHGIPLIDRLIASVDLLGRVGCAVHWAANASLSSPVVRTIMEAVLGISAQRPLPRYAAERFDSWFHSRQPRASAPETVLLWDDCFVRYNEPHIGRAAVAVLEAAGFDVQLPVNRKCCGRPAFSRGLLEDARELGEHNVELLKNAYPGIPVLFLEPSCYSMFAEDYMELGIKGASSVAKHCFTFEQFVMNLLERDPKAVPFADGPRRVAIHAHCHAKALTDTDALAKLGAYLPETSIDLLDTGCCGMAGAFGMMRDKYELSLQVAQPLVDLVNALPPDTLLVASGTSCRQQIDHLTNLKPIHMAELLAKALPGTPVDERPAGHGGHENQARKSSGCSVTYCLRNFLTSFSTWRMRSRVS